ncbi:Ig-like domain-containing protein [Marinobacter sp. HL-58]|uniref:Ig-like domain-containing protein n=1 Tax=Marinobacter sp. HL-58 TaxID=1479237 RepID=UPI00047F3A7D|nr:Ig-like domain-containing protein [Marinobacter sp. HL-58]KPP99232.1 MAG: Bacterial Ig-like domain [Marinobacter sp. HL-58]
MKYNKTLALIPAVLLAACGGDEQSINEPAKPGSVVYSYPADGQGEVSPKADLVLRFSHALSDDDIGGKIRISDGENNIDFSSEPVDQGRSLKISPDERLSPGTEYTVEFSEELEAEGGRPIPTPNAIGPDGIQFTTRGEFSGIAALDELGSGFTVAEMIPSENNTFRPMNFSTFRLRLTRAVHPEWKGRGGVIELTDSNGDTVPATVLVNGRYITIDPCIADSPEQCGREDDVLEAGETYTVSIRNLPGINGDTLEEFSEEVTPRDTSPTVVLFQEVIDSGLNAGADEDSARRSRLNGEIINGVTLNSVLQGIAGPSQQTGGLFAELAYAPSFEADEPLPLRVPKGSVLNSSSLDVRINGTVPIIDPETGQIQKTGNIKVTMLSDATGYLMPNPYTDDQNAPRHVRLFMDVSMNTEEAQPNASLSQDLLGVELSGIAIVEDGVLTIDAIGMVEPNLLGQEFTDSTIAFRIEAATDSESALDAADQRDDELADTTGPQLVSWMPGPEDALPDTRQDMQRPGDPVVLNFDEPLDEDSIEGNVTLDEDGVPLTIEDGTLSAEVDGTVLVLNPEGGLEHGVDYTVNIGGVTDLAGNAASVPALNFSLPETGDPDAVTQRSPFALTTYPGFPCVTTDVNLGEDGDHGYCKDKLSEEGSDLPEDRERDRLPITTLPADRPIVVVFSQSMDLETINDSTFIVEEVDDSGNSVETVAGRIEKNNQRVRFYPEKPWDEGKLYKYTLVSAQFGDPETEDESAADCTSVICGENGKAFAASHLLSPTANGSESLEIFFRGDAQLDTVFTPLRNLPIRDANSNYEIDDFETFDFEFAENPEGVEQDHYVTPPNASRLAMAGNATVLGNDGGEERNARVGCDYSGDDCPEEKFIYQTYGLNTEVVGPEIDPETGEETGRVKVLLYPTLLVTSPATVFYNLAGKPSESSTGPQVLRMRYQEKTEDNPLGLVEGYISEGEDGQPQFETEARLMLDAPNLHLPLGELNLLAHNLFSYPFTLDLEGDIQFFDDGRMQIEQRNINKENPAIDVVVAGSSDESTTLVGLVSCLGGVFTGSGTDSCDELIEGEGSAVKLPLEIPYHGLYLNFISNPIKEIPAEY